MVDRPNQANAAEKDYEKKFATPASKGASSQSIKEREATGDDSWKTAAKNSEQKSEPKKGRFGFRGNRAGKLRRGSAFGFIFALLIGGVWYTSVLAPNILLVNVKEMYTNDLADATTALEIYTQVAYFNKIGPLSGQDCIDGQPMSEQPMKCKLTTMSRSEKQAFEKQGFTFGLGDINVGGFKTDAGNVAIKKVYDDKRDDGDFSNDLPESRYKVYAIIPPSYSRVIDSLKATGTSTLMKSISGNREEAGNALSEGVNDAFNQLLNPLKSASQSPQKMVEAMLTGAPITSGPQLWIYSQINSTTKAQVYSVFNPRSSFFNDQKFKERIKTRYNTTRTVTTTGDTQQQVDRSFDNSVQKVDGGIDPLTGQPNPTDGVSLSSLSSPLSITQIKGMASNLTNGLSQESLTKLTNELPIAADLQIAGNLLATNTYNYTDLMCSWYTIGKISSNALVRAKASTAARYALQYLKAADSIKAGTSQEVPTNVLASKLAQHTLGGYGGGSATDSLIYRSVTYGDTFPNSVEDLVSFVTDPGKLINAGTDLAAIIAYNLSAYENIATLAPSWAQVIPNAAALGAVTGASGTLSIPPFSLNGSTDREYCLSGETTENKTAVKGETSESTRCTQAVTAMAPVGLQAAMAGALEVARRTCPPLNLADDNLIQLYLGTWRGPISNTVLPSQKIVQTTTTPYIAGWFSINTMLAAAATQQLYTSQVKGIAANYALFSGMGELLGDMSMSRGLVPSNTIEMMAYLYLGEIIGSQKSQDDVERHYAQQNQFDPYNKFSFAGSIVNQLSPTTDTNAPLFASLNNILSLVGVGAKQLGQTSTANAFYNSQPTFITTDNAAGLIERTAAYTARLSGAFCPLDLEALSIGIMPDIMCNVRYSMPLEDIPMALNLSGVMEYMTSSHEDAYQSQSQELDERIGKADAQGELQYLTLQKNTVEDVKSKPFIDKNTGKPTKNGEYEKYLQYCVNRLDPWGRSAIAMRYDGLSDEERAERGASQSPDYEAINRGGAADPNQKYAGGLPQMAVTSTQADQDWLSGKKCTRMTDQSQMLSYFRVYTMLCSVDGSMSNKTDCTQPDREGGYSDPFYLNNDILYTSWN